MRSPPSRVGIIAASAAVCGSASGAEHDVLGLGREPRGQILAVAGQEFVDELVALEELPASRQGEPGQLGIGVLGAQRGQEARRAQDVADSSELDDRHSHRSRIEKRAVRVAEHSVLLVRAAGTVAAKVAAVAAKFRVCLRLCRFAACRPINHGCSAPRSCPIVEPLAAVTRQYGWSGLLETAVCVLGSQTVGAMQVVRTLTDPRGSSTTPRSLRTSS